MLGATVIAALYGACGHHSSKLKASLNGKTQSVQVNSKTVFPIINLDKLIGKHGQSHSALCDQNAIKCV